MAGGDVADAAKEAGEAAKETTKSVGRTLVNQIKPWGADSKLARNFKIVAGFATVGSIVALTGGAAAMPLTTALGGTATATMGNSFVGAAGSVAAEFGSHAFNGVHWTFGSASDLALSAFDANWDKVGEGLGSAYDAFMTPS